MFITRFISVIQILEAETSQIARRARAHTHSYTKNIASDLLVVGFGFVCFFRFMVAGIEIFDSSSTCNCLVLRNK